MGQCAMDMTTCLARNLFNRKHSTIHHTKLNVLVSTRKPYTLKSKSETTVHDTSLQTKEILWNSSSRCGSLKKMSTLTLYGAWFTPILSTDAHGQMGVTKAHTQQNSAKVKECCSQTSFLEHASRAPGNPRSGVSRQQNSAKARESCSKTSFWEHAPRIRRIRRIPRSGVMTCCSGLPSPRAKSQDDVSSQANSLKRTARGNDGQP